MAWTALPQRIDMALGLSSRQERPYRGLSCQDCGQTIGQWRATQECGASANCIFSNCLASTRVLVKENGLVAPLYLEGKLTTVFLNQSRT